jgi:hypothetical protein
MTPMAPAGYRLAVRMPIKLLEALLDLFCGAARIAFEGDLSKCDLRGIPVVANESIGTLKRSTSNKTDWLRAHGREDLLRNPPEPESSFVVLSIEAETRDLIKRQILPQIGLRRRVYHVLIEKSGELVFASYDCFDPDSVWITDTLPEGFLASLVETKALKAYERETDSRFAVV